MSHKFEIKEGAFIVSDAHFSKFRPSFFKFLKDIDSNILKPTQLIFMGDIFDALFGGVAQTINTNQETINLINKLSLNIQTIYLEGNHDFNLFDIFPNVEIYPLKQQPVLCRFKDKKIYLAHGDINTDWKYSLYSKFIRNKFIIFILNFLNFLTNNMIIDKLDRYLSKKNDCNDFAEFESFINNRLENNYICDYFIEGHYHQNKSFKLKDFQYINLGAFACNQRYFIVKFSDEVELLENNNFSKGL